MDHQSENRYCAPMRLSANRLHDAILSPRGEWRYAGIGKESRHKARTFFEALRAFVQQPRLLEVSYRLRLAWTAELPIYRAEVYLAVVYVVDS